MFGGQLSVLNSQPSRCSFYCKRFMFNDFQNKSHAIIGILQRNFTVLNPNSKKNFTQRHQLLVAANMQSCGLVGKLQYLFVWFIVVYIKMVFGLRIENTSIPHCIDIILKYFAMVFSFELFPRDHEFPFHKMSSLKFIDGLAKVSIYSYIMSLIETEMKFWIN